MAMLDQEGRRLGGGARISRHVPSKGCRLSEEQARLFDEMRFEATWEEFLMALKAQFLRRPNKPS